MIETKEELQAKYFLGIWHEQKKTLTIEQKDKIGRAYLKYGVGVDDATIDDFLHNKFNASHSIGMRQAAIDEGKNDLDSFWKDVASITPESYSGDDITWLITKGRSIALYQMCLIIDPPWEIKSNGSALIGKIHTNAIAYK